MYVYNMLRAGKAGKGDYSASLTAFVLYVHAHVHVHIPCLEAVSVYTGDNQTTHITITHVCVCAHVQTYTHKYIPVRNCVCPPPTHSPQH